ncbi:hypothetical protein LTR17_015429 [Elasticomyces elasticus]|nr:hypothetical protein LTR17_015429 [Elasticomyces elasticus]
MQSTTLLPHAALLASLAVALPNPAPTPTTPAENDVTVCLGSLGNTLNNCLTLLAARDYEADVLGLVDAVVGGGEGEAEDDFEDVEENVEAVIA